MTYLTTSLIAAIIAVNASITSPGYTDAFSIITLKLSIWKRTIMAAFFITTVFTVIETITSPRLADAFPIIASEL